MTTSAVGKRHDSDTITAAGFNSQTIFYAVSLGFSTVLRLNDSGGKLTIGGNTYYPWQLGVSDIGIGQNLNESLKLTFFNADLDEKTDGTSTGNFTDLEAAADSTGTSITVYRVILELDGTQSEETYFTGTIDSVECSEKQWRITCLTAESLGTLLPANIDMGLCRWRTYGNTDCGISPIFTGSGLDDLTVEDYGEQSGPINFYIEITTAGAQDKFDWSLDGGSTWEEQDVNCSTGSTALGSSGFAISFGAITGHTDGDSWAIDGFCYHTYEDCASASKDNDLRFGGLPHSPLPGEKIKIPGITGIIYNGGYSPASASNQQKEEEQIPLLAEPEFPVHTIPDDITNETDDRTGTMHHGG